MMHLSAEELTLHYYDEGPDGAESHLATCEECRAGYRELQLVLNAADGYAPPERPAGYEAALWRRIERELPRNVRRPSRWFRRPAFATGLVAAVMAVAFFAGRWSAQAPPMPASHSDPVLLNALEHHVDRSQLVLTEVANGTAFERDDLTDLLEANRLYRQTAEMSGEAALAGVLEELEILLMEAEHSPGDSGQRRVETDGMLFKLRVLGDELRKKSDSGLAEETL
jgi:hypothetical protein